MKRLAGEGKCEERKSGRRSRSTGERRVEGNRTFTSSPGAHYGQPLAGRGRQSPRTTCRPQSWPGPTECVRRPGRSSAWWHRRRRQWACAFGEAGGAAGWTWLRLCPSTSGKRVDTECEEEAGHRQGVRNQAATRRQSKVTYGMKVEVCQFRVGRARGKRTTIRTHSLCFVKGNRGLASSLSTPSGLLPVER